MFDPYQPNLCNGSIFSVASDILRYGGDTDLAVAMLMHCADHGDTRACRWLAEYWLGRGKIQPPFVSYRNAAEYALAFRWSDYAQELLLECFRRCQPGELDDIKYRRTGICKNYDVEFESCLVNGEPNRCSGRGDHCDGWVLYVPVRHLSISMLRPPTESPGPLFEQGYELDSTDGDCRSVAVRNGFNGFKNSQIKAIKAIASK